VFRQATLVLVAAAALAPVAAAGRYSHTPQTPPQRVVVRTELVPASDGFEWLDAAAGFGVAVALVAVVLLVAGQRLARS
jgi:hypothetical protein